MKRAWGLRSKVLFASLCLISVLMIALALLLVQERRSRSEVLSISGESQSQLIEGVARAHAIAVATQLADALTNDLYYADLESIGQQLGFARQLPPTTAAIVYDARGQVIHDGSAEISTYGTSIDTPLIDAALANDETQVSTSEHLIEAAKRIRISDQILGGVLIRFDLGELQRAVTEGNAQLADRLDRSTRWRVGSVAIVLGGVALLALLCSWLIQRRIVRPILSLATAARKMEAGEYRSFHLNSGRGDEIGDLERSFERMSERVAESHRNAERRANIDKLTGLPNRRAFDEAIAARMLPEGIAPEFALMFIDVDNLKQINDQLGHDAGDTALVDFAQRASNVLERNSAGTAWLARIGGDEFAVLCSGRPLANAALGLAESIMSLFGEGDADGTSPGLTVSIGIATYPDDAQSASDLLRCADTAMYQAKHAGKRRIRFHDSARTSSAPVDTPQ